MSQSTGTLSKGIKLSYSTTVDGTYTDLNDLQGIPALGGTPEKVEVTTLADEARRYIKGIKSYSDLEFDFLFGTDATSGYTVLSGLEDDGVIYWKVTFKDGTVFAFSGEVSTAVQSAAVNAALTFKATITLNSDIAVTLPTT